MTLNPKSAACAVARSFLFVPGNRPELFEKAARSGADALIVDLEDSVPLDGKSAARQTIGAYWPIMTELSIPFLVRVNAFGSDAFRDDIAWLSDLPAPSSVMLPKAESASAIREVHLGLKGIPVFPIIESAVGLEAASSIAAADGVVRLVLGHVDFMTDLGFLCDDAQNELAPARFAIAMATRLNELAPAVDSVTVQLEDADRLRSDTHRALRFGFGGKLCIHPRQIAIVHEAFAPTEKDVDWARRVIAADAAAAGSAVKLDGRMIDVPVVIQARRTLARASMPGARQS